MTRIDDLAGRTAVVTGAGSGIGEAFAHRAAERGLRVLAVDVDQQRLDAFAEWAAAAGHEVRTSITDVSDYAAVSEAAATVADWGPAGLVVNNAGIEGTGRLWETDPARWARMQGINVNGVFNVTRAFLPDMIADGGPAHVVMMASIGALGTSRGNAGYLCSKFAVRVLAQCLRDELRDSGAAVGVTAVHPGPVRTGIFRDSAAAGEQGEALRAKLRAYLEKEGLEPAEIVRLALEAVEADQFWVHTHPEMSRRAVERHFADLREGLA